MVFSGEISTSIDIAAPPETVWSVLTAPDDLLGSKSGWNSFITGFEAPGGLEAGKAVRMTAKPPGQRAGTFSPKLLAVTPNKELRWRGSLPIPGLFVGEHFFRLEPSADGSCHFVHGEKFTGLLVPLLKGLLRDTEKGFVAMNEGLKAAAEGKGTVGGAAAATT